MTALPEAAERQQQHKAKENFPLKIRNNKDDSLYACKHKLG